MQFRVAHLSEPYRGEARGEPHGILKEKREILERLVQRKFGITADDSGLIARCDDSVHLDAAVGGRNRTS